MSNKGIYLVTYSADSILSLKPNEESLLSRKVEANTFLAVEDWADENCPTGYGLWSIEKVYHSGADAMYGETDAVL